MSANDRIGAVKARLIENFQAGGIFEQTGVSISIGSALAIYGDSSETLLHRADEDMFRAKVAYKQANGSYR